METPIFKHNYDFDPSYGYRLESLREVEPGKAPGDFVRFWQDKYKQALQISPGLTLRDTGKTDNNWRIFDCSYMTTDNMQIGGWLLLPADEPVHGALVLAHGYIGLEQPDTSWQLRNTALLFPLARGIGRSAAAPISSDPQWHVLHNVQDKNQYILGGCVQDFWCAVSALLTRFPQVKNRVGFAGTSFGGGIGIFACAFDPRICCSHFNVPAFGNPDLRMNLPTVGSTAALRRYAQSHPKFVNETLPYFDASCAAALLTRPSHWALALFDPAVAPPGQFSAYNACPPEHKQLYLLEAGHFAYPNEFRQQHELRRILGQFFASLGETNAS